MTRVVVYGFLLGALSVAVFHQGTIFLLYHFANGVPAITSWIGEVTNPGWNLSQVMPSPPIPGLAIPVVVNQMFWGGLWGIVIAAIIRFTRFPSLLSGLLVGAIGCVGVAVTVVAALKGLPLFANGNTQALLRATLINGAFGWGTAALLRSFAMRQR